MTCHRKVTSNFTPRTIQSLALLPICPTSYEENWLANFECKNIQSITSKFFCFCFSFFLFKTFTTGFFSERHELNPTDLWTIPARMVREWGVNTYIWVQQQQKKKMYFLLRLDMQVLVSFPQFCCICLWDVCLHLSILPAGESIHTSAQNYIQ